MNCVGCKHAKWELNSAGRLHPSGDGRCAYPIEDKMPPLPVAFYWPARGPTFYGGHIHRRRTMNRGECPYYEKIA